MADFVIRHPFILLLIGFCQFRFTELYPDRYLRPFPFFELPTIDGKPGTIHATAYGYFIHEYVYYIMIWLFCIITTKYKQQFQIILCLELFDLVDFLLRYNQSFMDLLGWPIEYTDLKMASYFLIAYSTIQCKTSI